MTASWMKGTRAAQWAAAAAVAGVIAAIWYVPAVRDQPVVVLDPARIILLRTPGGFLEVGAMEKIEEFGWSSRYTCPLVDCPTLLTPTISRVRVRAHYVYRVPLAAEWALQLDGDHYRLTVPQPQLQDPVAFHTKDMEIQTSQRGWFSPPETPNREALVRHLGPELVRRGAEAAYLAAQRPNAEKTLQEFARKWMIEQGKKTDLPVKVVFAPANPL